MVCLYPVCRDQFAGIPGAYLKRLDKAQQKRLVSTAESAGNNKVIHREMKQKNNE